jgi:hypothetical protein
MFFRFSILQTLFTSLSSPLLGTYPPLPLLYLLQLILYPSVAVTIIEYIEATPSAEVRKLLLAAHSYLQETLPPFATAGFKWRLPFYTLFRPFGYINRHPDHITMGFSQGYKLEPRPGFLLDENGKLKQVRYGDQIARRTLFARGR